MVNPAVNVQKQLDTKKSWRRRAEVETEREQEEACSAAESKLSFFC